MDVSGISVRFARKVQAQQYEPVEGEVTLHANVHPGEDVAEAASRLMNLARQTVIDGLRGGKPTETAAVALNTAAGLTGLHTPPEGGAAPAASTGTEPKAERGAGLAAHRAKVKAEKEAAAAAAAAKAGTDAGKASDIPDETAPKQDNISTGGERVDPSDIPDDTTAGKATGTKAPAATSDIPDEPKATTTAAAAAADAGAGDKLTADELQAFITKNVQSKKVPVQKIKDILASHGVSRTSELAAADLQTVKDEIEMAALA